MPLAAEQPAQMQLRACEILLDGSLVHSKRDGDLLVGIFVAPSRQEYRAALGRQLVKRGDRMFHFTGRQCRSFGIRHGVRHGFEFGLIDASRPGIPSHTVESQIYGHAIEIGPRLPKVRHDRSGAQLDICVMQRIRGRLSRSQVGRQSGKQRGIFVFQDSEQSGSRVRWVPSSWTLISFRNRGPAVA